MDNTPLHSIPSVCHSWAQVYLNSKLNLPVGHVWTLATSGGPMPPPCPNLFPKASPAMVASYIVQGWRPSSVMLVSSLPKLASRVRLAVGCSTTRAIIDFMLSAEGGVQVMVAVDVELAIPLTFGAGGAAEEMAKNIWSLLIIINSSTDVASLVSRGPVTRPSSLCYNCFENVMKNIMQNSPNVSNPWERLTSTRQVECMYDSTVCCRQVATIYEDQ